MNGTDLLAEFRKSRADGAFGELVRRYTNLVYSVAKRRLDNVSLAEEVTQSVFLRLAKAAPNLRGDAELAAWLHRTTVHASIDLWRSEVRRRAREQHAVAMQPEPTENTTWNEIAPVLDDALNELNDAERQVLLLRFFEQKTMRDLGLVLGISEDAAKMRVSRAMEHLRTMFSARRVACGAAALGALLTERAVEAAPAGLAPKLAALNFPAAAGLGAGAGLAGLLAQGSKAKLVVGLSTALIMGGAAIVWLVSAIGDGRVPTADAGQRAASNLAAAEKSEAALPASADPNAAAEEQPPDPLKLLQEVARARNRITSGEMQFEVARYETNRPLDGTNRMRLEARFDGNKRRFESFAREYSYTSTAPDASEVTDVRRRAEGLDREAAMREGLLKGFESHHVTAYDGALLLDYWENDGRPVSAKIDDPAKGGVTAFDPRCLGIDISPSVVDTIERCLPYGDAAAVQLLGEELVEGVPAWHVRARRGSMNAEFWLETGHPVRVLKHAFNGSVVVSKYDDAHPQDPIPIAVTEMVLHGTTGTQTAVYEKRITRRNTRFNIPVEPTSWTLAGLGMKIGTDVVDLRISRRIGYWTGTGLSENLPSKTREPQGAPDRAELLALLENEPVSPAALEAAQWIIANTPDSPDVEKAAEVILQEHIFDANLVHLCLELERLRHRCSRKLLEAMVENNPSEDVRGNACLALATLRKDEAKHGKNQQATTEARKLFARVIADFGRVKRNGTLLADLAKPELYELRQVIIGKPAPPTEGEDLEGRPMKLSDYQGKVVVLIFWGKCGGCRPDVPPLLGLLDRFKEKPFAILGVYCDDDLAKANAIVQESGATWPSFRDGQSGPISTAWNNNSWPAFNVLDSKGLIRFRNWSDIKVSVVDDLLRE